MDISTISNILLEVFYIMIGLYMAVTMVFTLKDKNHKTRIGTALFWGIVSVNCIFGKLIASKLGLKIFIPSLYIDNFKYTS